jgi:FtsZ-interacting cell division protein ZipA
MSTELFHWLILIGIIIIIVLLLVPYSRRRP